MRYRSWLAIGQILLATVAVLSLIPLDAPLPVENGDKLEHLLVYASLAGWWQLPPGSRRRHWLTGLGLVTFGALLELLQGLTPYRTPDPWDALANSLGVLLGSLLATSPIGRHAGSRYPGRA